MFRSIRWRITFAFGALILVSIVGLSFYVSYSVRGKYMADLKSHLTAEARIIADQTSVYLDDPANVQALQGIAVKLGQDIDTRVTIIDSQGTVLADSDEDPAAMENHLDRPEVAKALAGEESAKTRHSETEDQDMMYVAVPVTVGGNIVAVARVALPLTDVNEAVADLNRGILISAACACVVAVLIGLYISHVTVGPIKTLTEDSKKLAAGDLAHKIEVSSGGEVGDLARSLSQMAARLKCMIALMETERDRMVAILASLGDALFVVDAGGMVEMMNSAAERMFKVSLQQKKGKTFIEIVRDHEIDEVLKACIAAGEQRTRLVELRGGELALWVVATPLQGGAGAVVLLHDMTDLRRTHIMRREFVSNISHELCTPIASLSALAETLSDGAIDDPNVSKDFLNRMKVEVDKLAQMVQELGELSRLEGGQIPLNKTKVDITATINRAAARLRAQADRAGLKLQVSAQEMLPTVLADGDRVEQVVVNLLHNAIKFTPPGGAVSVTAFRERDRIVISVNDTGIGISADALPRIFERFYKVDRARTGGGGTGLGLAIAKHIVQAHGGEIWAESEEGRGSTFYFSIPLAT